MPDAIVTSAYRTLRNAVNDTKDKKLKTTTLQDLRNRAWKELASDKRQDPALNAKFEEVTKLINKGKFSDASAAIMDLKADIAFANDRFREAKEAFANDTATLKKTYEPDVAKENKPTRVKFAKLVAGKVIKKEKEEEEGGEKKEEEQEKKVVDPTVGMVESLSVDGSIYKNPEFLGKGQFGNVGKYTNKKGKTVVVKHVHVTSDDELKDVVAEIQNVERLMQGPKDAVGRENIMEIRGFDIENGLIVMDMASGDLNGAKKALNAASDAGAMTEEARNVLNQFMMKQALEGLSYIRDQGMVHLDLKEGNMLIMPDGTVKIADFGGSVFDVEPNSEIAATRGTELYQEYAHQNTAKYAKADLRAEANKTDTYTMGIVMNLMHQGVDPLEKTTHLEVDPKNRETGVRNIIKNNVGKEKEDGSGLDISKNLTGALKYVYDAMTQANAENRPVLEAVLESSYIKNLEDYDEKAVRELMVANLEYGSALRGIKEEDRDVKSINMESAKIRKNIRALEKAAEATEKEIQSIQEGPKWPEEGAMESGEGAMEPDGKTGSGSARIDPSAAPSRRQWSSASPTTGAGQSRLKGLNDRLKEISLRMENLKIDLQKQESRLSAHKPHLENIQKITQRLQGG